MRDQTAFDSSHASSGKGRAATSSYSFYLSEQQLSQKTSQADSGDADAAFALHQYYATHSHFVPESDAQATKWLRRAAELEHPVAQFSLGYGLLNNQDSSDDREALALIRVAAEAGDTIAKEHLEWLEKNGYGPSDESVRDLE